MTASPPPGYHLGERTHHGALLGLRLPQILLLSGALIAVVLPAASTRSTRGLLTGTTLALVCAVLAFGRAGGEPLYSWAPTLTGYLTHRAGGRGLWLAPLPLLTGTPPTPHQSRPTSRRARVLPRCLAGLELLAVERPDWAGPDTTLAPVGLIRDRRHHTLTIVARARGHAFLLLDPHEQHTRIQAWGQVLAQFGREISPLVRLGWSLSSTPTTPRTTDTEHPDWFQEHSHPPGYLPQVADTYERLLDDTPLLRHDLRIWITVAASPQPQVRPRRPGRHGSVPPGAEAALAAARVLSERCISAGLVISPPLSPVQIADATRLQADPTLHTTAACGLTTRTGLASTLNTTPGPPSALGPGVRALDPTPVAPLAVQPWWNSVQIDSAWHRAFWISHWPSTVSDPHWLSPLLHDTPCARTLTVIYEPISPRTSRRNITADAVAVDSHLQLRERHDLRVPVGLHHAHHDIDQREAELAAGHTEVGLLALIVLTETSPERLDEATQTLLDQAAHTGITGLRPLHARHDAAWACTLPLGRTPDRELLHGIPQ
jgi:hypothetical protein